MDLAAGTALYLSTPRAEFLSGRFVFGNWDMEEVEAITDIIVGEDLLKTRIGLGDFFEERYNAHLRPRNGGTETLV